MRLSNKTGVKSDPIKSSLIKLNLVLHVIINYMDKVVDIILIIELFKHLQD